MILLFLLNSILENLLNHQQLKGFIMITQSLIPLRLIFVVEKIFIIQSFEWLQTESFSI